MFFTSRRCSLTLASLLLLNSQTILADQFHYQNFIVGDRAVGLGGAYTGVADDASGVYYNPAGTAFALSNDISGSANAIYNKTLTFKKTLGTEDFLEKSGGTVPSFFGGLLKIENILEGLVLAWGIYSIDNELKDQDDFFKNVTLGANVACPGGTAQPPDNVLKRFHRTVNSRSSTEYVGASLGWRVRNNLAIGAGLNYVKVGELVQEYQDVKQSSHYCKSDGGFAAGTQTLTQNIRQQLSAYGLQPVIGVQASVFGRLSLGLTVKFGTYVAQKFEQTAEIRKVKLLKADQSTVENESLTNPLPSLISPSVASIFQNNGTPETQDQPLGSMPSNIRLGLAYFASPRLLITSDVVHVTEVTDADQFGGFTYSLYGKEAVTNVMAGLEYYLIPSVPVRIGFFTNNDARPEVDKTQVNQRNHVDWTGGSVFLAWVQPNSQIGAGVIVQTASGYSQKIGGVNVVQDVEGQSFTLGFSATTTL